MRLVLAQCGCCQSYVGRIYQLIKDRPKKRERSVNDVALKKKKAHVFTPSCVTPADPSDNAMNTEGVVPPKSVVRRKMHTDDRIDGAKKTTHAHTLPSLVSQFERTQ